MSQFFNCYFRQILLQYSKRNNSVLVLNTECTVSPVPKQPVLNLIDLINYPSFFSRKLNIFRNMPKISEWYDPTQTIYFWKVHRSRN